LRPKSLKIQGNFQALEWARVGSFQLLVWFLVVYRMQGTLKMSKDCFGNPVPDVLEALERSLILSRRS